MSVRTLHILEHVGIDSELRSVEVLHVGELFCSPLDSGDLDDLVSSGEVRNILSHGAFDNSHVGDFSVVQNARDKSDAGLPVVLIEDSHHWQCSLNILKLVEVINSVILSLEALLLGDAESFALCVSGLGCRLAVHTGFLSALFGGYLYHFHRCEG